MPRRWKVINKKTRKTLRRGYRTKTRAHGYSRHLNKFTCSRRYTVKPYFV